MMNTSFASVLSMGAKNRSTVLTVILLKVSVINRDYFLRGLNLFVTDDVDIQPDIRLFIYDVYFSVCLFLCGLGSRVAIGSANKTWHPVLSDLHVLLTRDDIVF